MNPQIEVASLLLILLALFAWGKWRYDGVALIVLAIMVLRDLVPVELAFLGFGHPAVVTVALVLLISKGLEKSGFIGLIGDHLMNRVNTESQFLVAIMITAALLSSFMNNIGAMAMLLPITIGIAQKMDWNPSKFLMPLAFASILGGMNTKIGTPPNIIISEFRESYVDKTFDFFHFSYAGLPVSFIGILFIAFIGWRLVKLRENSGGARPLVDLQEYLIEMTINEESDLVGKRVHEFRRRLGADTVLVGAVNEKGKKRKLNNFETFSPNQILIFKTSPEDVASVQQQFGLTIDPELKMSKEGDLGEIEAMITPRSRLNGRRYNYFKRMAGEQLALLGLWRQGSKFRFRLAREIFKAGDVLLLASRGNDESTGEKLELLGLMPLWQRELDVIRDSSQVKKALLFFCVALLLVATNILNIIVAFLLCVLAFASMRLLTGEGIYRHVEWPIVVMLGAMIPIGGAITSSGLDQSIVEFITIHSQNLDPIWVLTILLIFTMFLSDLINNAATALIMAPIGVTLAHEMNQPIEPFLMAIAVGASCAFLSPIGHQCNTLVMGPGNYRFGDYWRLGLPLEVIIVIVAIPMIFLTWF